MADTVLDIITDALIENGSYGEGDGPVSAANAALGLRVLNRELDSWAARRAFVYSTTFTLFTLTPNHQPHLIGPGLASPDFAVVQRPVKIESAALRIPGTIDIPLRLRDDEWWANERLKTLATPYPTDLRYSADWPNGACWLWPIPTIANGLLLELWGLISQFTGLTQAFSLPPAARKAIVLTLAERLCRPFGKPLRADLVADARQARYDFQRPNIKSKRIASTDAGTGGRGARRETGSYYDGWSSE